MDPTRRWNPTVTVRRIGGGSQDSAHVSVGRAFALVGALDHGWLNAEPRGTPITCGTTRTKATGGPATTQALCRSPSKDTNPNRQASSITSRRCSGPNSRPDIYTFAPTDAVPDALVLQCSTVAGEIDGDEPVMRVAYVDDDDAQFTAEGDGIPEVRARTRRGARSYSEGDPAGPTLQRAVQPDEHGKPTGAVGFARRDPAGQSGVCG